MSTNDTVIALANGKRGRQAAGGMGGEDFARFQAVLNHVTRNLARMIVEDGEGVTRFVEVQVSGAVTFQDARKAAEAVANSMLVKCAWYGGDPNWGRILDAHRVQFGGVARGDDRRVLQRPDRREGRRGQQDAAREAAGGRASSGSSPSTSTWAWAAAEYVVYTTDLTPEYVRFNKGRVTGHVGWQIQATGRVFAESRLLPARFGLSISSAPGARMLILLPMRPRHEPRIGSPKGGTPRGGAAFHPAVPGADVRHQVRRQRHGGRTPRRTHRCATWFSWRRSGSIP